MTPITITAPDRGTGLWETLAGSARAIGLGFVLVAAVLAVVLR